MSLILDEIKLLSDQDHGIIYQTRVNMDPVDMKNQIIQ